MRRSFSVLIFLLISFATILAQKSPVAWTFDVNKVDDRSVQIICNAKMNKDWVIYSSKIKEGGPIATSIEVTKGGIHKGDIIEPRPAKNEYDDLFEMEVRKFYSNATFIRNLELESEAKIIEGYVQFMTCDGEKCLPPTKVPFSLALNP